MSAVNLDDSAIYRKLDPDGMFSRVRETADECARAWQSAADFVLPPYYREVNKVVILGMGGSAIGGDLLRTLAAPECPVPILVNRDYGLPAHVDAGTLVIASSYSGNTEETLAVFQAALATEAKKMVITTGGKIKEMAEKNGVPTFVFSYRAQPRAALAWSLFPLLSFMQQLGLMGDQSGAVTEMLQALCTLTASYAEEVPETSNPAKQLARLAVGKVPVVYGAGVLAEVAHRWKTQTNENAKSWAFHEAFSELNHNAVVGYEFPAAVASQMFVFLLRSDLLHERQQLRYGITAELLQMAKVDYRVVQPDGGGLLAQVMALVLLGDYVSNYLALLNGTDPTPVKPIDYLKDELKKSP